MNACLCCINAVQLQIMQMFFLTCTSGDLIQFVNSPRINGTTFAESLGDWYFGRGKVPTQLVDSCHTVDCNPDCRKKQK